VKKADSALRNRDHTIWLWIAKWGETAAPQCHEIEALVWRASPEWAPADTIDCDLAGRKTITDIRDQETLAAPGHDPSRPAGERRRFSL
jgi:hypothetical protein